MHNAGDHAVQTRAALGLWLRSFMGLGAGSRCVQEIDPAAVGPAAIAHLLTAMVRTALVLVKPITARLNSL